MYWHQGWCHAPDVVKRCVSTWQTHNPTWRIHLLDAASIAGEVRLPSVMEKLQPTYLASRSDVVRLLLLRKYGGVWADATLWCARPLDDWIDSVTEPSGFFAYDKPGPGPNYRGPIGRRPISNWFLAASEDSRIVDIWCSGALHLLKKSYAHVRYRKMMEGRENGALFDIFSNLYACYLSKRYRYEYLLIPAPPPISSPPPPDLEGERYSWPHVLFQKLLDRNKEFRDLWGRTPKLSAHGPHLLLHEGYLSAPTNESEAAISNRHANVIKLTHKEPFPEDVSGTLLGVLYRSAESSGNLTAHEA